MTSPQERETPDRCKCGAFTLDPFIGTYATLEATHTREGCTRATPSLGGMRFERTFPTVITVYLGNDQVASVRSCGDRDEDVARLDAILSALDGSEIARLARELHVTGQERDEVCGELLNLTMERDEIREDRDALLEAARVMAEVCSYLPPADNAMRCRILEIAEAAINRPRKGTGA